MEANWISVHVFIKGNADEFLRVLYRELVRRRLRFFFFIRYSEPAFHIRLRVKAEGYDISKERGTLLRLFESLQNKIERSYKIKRFCLVDYQAELSRYGGPKGVRIAESFFYSSSLLVLRRINSNKLWGTSERIGFAVQASFLFIEATTLNPSGKKRLLESTFESWLNRHVSGGRSTKAETKAAFAKSFFAQKCNLEAQIKKLACLPQNPGDLLGNDMTGFIQAVKKDDEMLRRRIDRNEIADVLAGEKETSKIMSVLYESYLHMMNNRIGLSNIEESYVAYLLMNLTFNSL